MRLHCERARGGVRAVLLIVLLLLVGHPSGSSGAVTGQFVVTGKLEPAVSDAWLTVDYSPKSGPTISRQVRTGADGAFKDEFAPPARGGWTVRAFWTGSATQSSATTEAITPAGDAEGGGGIVDRVKKCGKLNLLLIALLVLLVAWLIVRSRKRRRGGV